MKFNPLPTLAAALLLVPSSLCAQGPNQPAKVPEPPIQTGGEVAATAAIEVWVALVDDNRFAESWQASAGIFKKAVTQEQWVSLMQAHRQPLGKVLSRKIKGKQFMRMVPGAPDGQYVVVQYDTSFEHKQTAVETVTSMVDADGQWRVAGYYVR